MWNQSCKGTLWFTWQSVLTPHERQRSQPTTLHFWRRRFYCFFRAYTLEGPKQKPNISLQCIYRGHRQNYLPVKSKTKALLIIWSNSSPISCFPSFAPWFWGTVLLLLHSTNKTKTDSMKVSAPTSSLSSLMQCLKTSYWRAQPVLVQTQSTRHSSGTGPHLAETGHGNKTKVAISIRN